MNRARRGPRLVLFAAAATALTILAAPRQKAQSQQPPKNPWTAAELMEPGDLAKLITTGKPRPKVVCVGFHALFRGGHVPGAEFHGPAESAEGLADLKAWAGKQPRDAMIVLYCGCCPFSVCPNLRPAYTELHDLGFTKLRLLNLPHDFARDWVEKGYPTEKGGP